jgi:hypothetical protein
MVAHQNKAKVLDSRAKPENAPRWGAHELRWGTNSPFRVGTKAAKPCGIPFVMSIRRTIQ